MTRVRDIPVRDTTRVRDVRVAAEEAAAEAGLDPLRCASVALVATELATNMLKHAGGGQVLIETVPHVAAGPVAQAVQILALDHGPGIADIAEAAVDGFSTTESLGIGLGTCRRLCNDFDMHSRPGRGTTVLARLAPERSGHFATTYPARAGGLHIPLAAAAVSGDAASWYSTPSGVTVMLADGLGHGEAAAEASDAAVRTLHQNPDLPPQDLLRSIEAALQGTRGAAVAVAHLDAGAQRLSFAGTGNIGARLRTGGAWEHLLSRPGIVGAYRHARPASTQSRPWADDAMLVLHSDGLPSRWASPDDPTLDPLDPALIAAVILRDTLSPASPVRDDTTLTVLTATAAATPRGPR
ncbi:phosphatase [Streptomyces ambofaciens]|uniref:Phosphatase n=1 Tax=Streptomyces ambofaciens TaxID=1889 RepID=A0ABM6B9I5_STRAM|nr:anti-sigma regulatory factor [Streptomyces ambofaciens]ANB10586.1 phosphatase [Streptomyces ambofaciens]